MSKIAISGASTGTATFTIESPATSTDRTLTLPDNTGTILTNATTAGFPAGSVLQVVSATYSTSTTIATTAFTDSGLSSSITPTSASSKILIFWAIPAELFISSPAERVATFQLLRSSTEINQVFMSMESVIRSGQTVNSVVLDSPSTTSSTTYKVQVKVDNTGSSTSITAQRYGLDSNIILMEIAA
jgi:hypothetical protein